MSPTDAALHVLNFFAPAVVMGLVAPLLAKLLWRRKLADTGYGRLAAWSLLANAGVLVIGLVLQGRDGTMATYASMVVATAVALWWAGFAGRG